MALSQLTSVLVGLSFVPMSIGQHTPREEVTIIGLGLARKIVLTALKEEGITRRRGFNVELSCHPDDRFCFDAAEWATPKWAAASGIIHYTVNRVTGEVWEPMGCVKITSPSIAKAQRHVQKLLKLSPEAYKKASLAQPCP